MYKYIIHLVLCRIILLSGTVDFTHTIQGYFTGL